MSLPVKLARSLENRASQTFLRHYSNCPRSAFFYAAYRGEAKTAAMVRGTALHVACERALEAMIQQGEPMIEPDLMDSIVSEVLAEMPVPISEHDYLREMAFRWSSEWTVDPARVIAVERLIVLDLAGWEVRCKVDFAETLAGGMAVRVADWKTSRAPASQDEIARKRPDGTLAAKQLQLILYALVLAYGVPVRETWAACRPCHGTGRFGGAILIGGLWMTADKWSSDEPDPCPECEGRGGVRTQERDPFPLCSQAEQFELELVYPGVEGRDGLMVRRPVTLTRLELGKYRESLIGLLGRLAESERTGDWPAIVGEGCPECPCPSECPIPRELRNHAGTINDLDEAQEAGEWLDRTLAQSTALRRELRAWAKAHGVEIPCGPDKRWAFSYSESDRIGDKDAMFDAMDRAVQYGEPFDRRDWVRTSGVTNFNVVKATANDD